MSSAPDYVEFEPRGRDELLSQIGGFSPAERDLFQRLCDSWAPTIDARHVIATGESSPEQEESALERLMAKLRAAQIGFLTHTTTETGSSPDKIILTGKGSLLYWFHVVSETVSKLLVQGFQILPSIERLKASRALPPDYHCFDADSSQLVEAYANPDGEPTIFRLRLMDEYRVMYTTDTARPLVLRAIAVLRRDVMERGVVDELARLLDTTIAETRAKLSSKAPDSWLQVSRMMVKERRTIAFRKNFEETDEIFQLAYLVMTFVDAQIGMAREQKEHEAEVEEELESVERAVLEASGGTLSEELFAAAVGEAQERAGEGAALLSRKLESELLTPPSRRRLPRVVFAAECYIHSTRVRSVFENRRRAASRQLMSEYTDIMEAYLRGRTAEIGEIFSSRDLLNEDIGRRISRNNPLLAALLARPQMLAEAVILEAKSKRDGLTPEELKTALSGYFDVESSQLLPFSELMSVDIVAVFDEAYSRTGVIRQLLLRLSGRHESLRANYIRRFGPKRKGRMKYTDDGTPTGGRSRNTLPADATGTRTRGTGNRSHRPETVSSRRARPAPPPPKPKVKSPQEIDKVWQEFNEALHTRPSKEDPS